MTMSIKTWKVTTYLSRVLRRCLSTGNLVSWHPLFLPSINIPLLTLRFCWKLGDVFDFHKTLRGWCGFLSEPTGPQTSRCRKNSQPSSARMILFALFQHSWTRDSQLPKFLPLLHASYNLMRIVIPYHHIPCCAWIGRNQNFVFCKVIVLINPLRMILSCLWLILSPKL